MTNNIHVPGERITMESRAQGALLGAAVGDALGWPYENRSRNISKRPNLTNNVDLHDWHRRAGGRFRPHTEIIRAGEYSDDTQLIVSTARALQSGLSWWKTLTQVELPLWTFYERGGGGATKRAAEYWLAGKAPWEDEKNLISYFGAGGNGVAMRIVPHCLKHHSDPNFSDAALEIIANGVTTHGHPRALVGALVFGYSVWIALKKKDTLQYGELVRRCIDEVGEWSALPDISAFATDWKTSAQLVRDYQYDEVWHSAVEEVLEQLRAAERGIKGGILSDDVSVLEEIGCLDKKIGGAGTVTATGAIYLASRHAAAPHVGMVSGATTLGADTDTLASMAASLLGAFCGYEWLAPYLDKLQDKAYIDELAHSALEPNSDEHGVSEVPRVTKSDLNKFTKTLTAASVGEEVIIPGGYNATVCQIAILPSGEAFTARLTKLKLALGQTIFVKKVSKDENRAEGELRDGDTQSQNLEFIDAYYRQRQNQGEVTRPKILFIGNPLAEVVLVAPISHADALDFEHLSRLRVIQMTDKAMSAASINPITEVLRCFLLLDHSIDGSWKLPSNLRELRESLWRQIGQLNPKTMVIAGATANWILFRDQIEFGRLNWKWVQANGYSCVLIDDLESILKDSSKEKGSRRWNLWNTMKEVRQRTNF
jgi:ADP-ribosylglycohydrolase